MRFRYAALIILTCSCIFSIQVFAQEETLDKETRDKAQEYFRRGEILFDAGDFDGAAEAFMRAHETLPHPITLLNTALSYENGDKILQAIVTYEKYLTAIESQDSEDPDVEQRLARLKKKVGKIDVSATCASDACSIRVDGVDHGDAPAVVMVIPGSHHVEIMDGDEVVASEYVVIGAGEVKDVYLEPTQPEHQTPKPPTMPVEVTQPDPWVVHAPPARRSGLRKLRAPFWITAGSTVVVGATGLGLWWSVISDKKEFDAKDLDDDDEYLEAEKIGEKAEKKQIAAVILAGTAGGVAVAATILAIRDFKSSKKEAPNRVSFQMGPGIGVNVRF
ncbi:MAG: hypothetical protein QNJ97_19040 [Myxococcota bacterium]|nr:hypothetical protein [Myxococcota bacterium]